MKYCVAAVVILFLICFLLFVLEKRKNKKYKAKYLETIHHNEQLINVLQKYCMFQAKGNCIEKYCENNNLVNIVIFGYGFVGEMILSELINSNTVNVAYVIDRNYRILNIPYDSCSIDTIPNLYKIDAVLVTAVNISEDIKRIIEEKTLSACIMIEDVINYYE